MVEVIPAGTLLGNRFELRKRIGAGGMGEVFEAHDCETGELLALKVLARADGDTVTRFKREFRAVQATSHPNLVSLRELVRDGESWFFTMELVRGHHFMEYVGRDMARLRPALRQLTDGLRILHDAGLIHRDIKPSNVMVTPTGRVVLLDFGLVTAADPARQSMNTVGTIEYMAPEQAFGQKVSEASDWYSVGVMLYEALTGQLPYAGHPMQILVEKKQREATPPDELAPGAPPDLAALCRELLRIDPERRPLGTEIDRIRVRRHGSARDPRTRPRSSSAGSNATFTSVIAPVKATSADAQRNALARRFFRVRAANAMIRIGTTIAAKIAAVIHACCRANSTMPPTPTARSAVRPTSRVVALWCATLR